jgi:hypothetical protein
VSELSAWAERLFAPENSWRVLMGEGGDLEWVAGEETLHSPPARGCGQRVLDFFLGLLPVPEKYR